jgi:hypothetical protein
MRTLLLVIAVLGCGGSKSSSDSNPEIDAPKQYKEPYADCAGMPMTMPPANSLCLGNPTAPTGTPPIAVIEHSFVTYMNKSAIYIRIIFDPTFADNTYGANTVGWSRAHTFRDLVGSDHATVTVLDTTGNVALQFDLDYITADASAPCGYKCLGVDGGEGRMITGPRSAILGYMSSIDRNINERGYCSFIVDSPATDAMCTPNPAAPNWDFRVVYEVWLDAAYFAAPMPAFGSSHMSFVHASPSKASTNTVTTKPETCPCTEIDPNDCGPPTGGSCTTSTECNSESFCYEGSCVPIVLF